MSSSASPLLPLYIVRVKNRFGLNEKNLILLLLITSVISLFFILRHLPSNVVGPLSRRSASDEEGVEQIRRLFVPRMRNDSHQIIHNERHRHEIDAGGRNPELANESDNNAAEEAESVKEPVATAAGPVPKNTKAKKTVDDPVNSKRREKVKEMTRFAWDSYRKYAWGANELRPNSRSGHQAGIFGSSRMGASIVDAMDTLHMMGLTDEFNAGKEWIEKHFTINVNTEMSTFEINIRFVGGFLALYSLTKDKMFLDKAEEVATALLPAFGSPTGLPYSLFNPITKEVKNYNWAAGSCSILAELGSISLEFQYLTDLTGNKVFEEKVDKIFAALNKVNKDEGLYYNYINPATGTWCSRQAGLGGLSDSFYEYLLKLYLYKGKSDKQLLRTYLDAMEAVKQKLISRSASGLVYAGEYTGSGLVAKMGHLACFTGGMFALTAMYVDELDTAQRDSYAQLARDITHTCHESYARSPTHIGPESFSLDSGHELQPIDRYYILRPEVVESYFVLWRMTRNQTYRDWAWDAVEALERYCRTDNGYSGLRDVGNSAAPSQDDVQQSFFFAETLKYLYLIFADEDVMALDEYVFNTEAHPFRIRQAAA